MKKILLIMISILGISSILFLLLNRCQSREYIEPLDVYFLDYDVVLCIGEIKEVKWRSSREITPRISVAGNAAVVVGLTSDGVRIRGISAGNDILRLVVEEKHITLNIKVVSEKFFFDYEYEEMRLGEERVFNISAEPELYLRTIPIDYYTYDENIVKILSFDNKGVRVISLLEGMTVLRAEWRGMITELEIWVTNKPQRLIRIPYERRYINVGQEVNVELEMENMFPGEEEDFSYSLERGKSIISISYDKNNIRIIGRREGTQYLEINHPNATDTVRITYNVIPARVLDPPEIDISESPLIIKVDEEKRMRIFLRNSRQNPSNFTFSIINGINNIEARKDGSEIMVKGMLPGVSVIRIRHPSVIKEYEAMVIIDDMEGFYKFDPLR